MEEQALPSLFIFWFIQNQKKNPLQMVVIPLKLFWRRHFFPWPLLKFSGSAKIERLKPNSNLFTYFSLLTKLSIFLSLVILYLMWILLHHKGDPMWGEGGGFGRGGECCFLPLSPGNFPDLSPSLFQGCRRYHMSITVFALVVPYVALLILSACSSNLPTEIWKKRPPKCHVEVATQTLPCAGIVWETEQLQKEKL